MGFDIMSLQRGRGPVQARSRADEGRAVLKYIDVEDLVPSEDNFYSMSAIDELAGLIELSGGVKQPGLVVPLGGGKYKLLSGHRRRLASLQLVKQGKEAYRKMPCMVEDMGPGCGAGRPRAGVRDMRLLLGGSPCTHWSIAQTKNRETEPEGLGWELFKNYLIALEKFKPDFFLYENNKSMAPAIRAQITRELGVEPILINSALVSAQSRQRLYWTNIPGVKQPEDRGIVLRDILESGLPLKEKAYTLRASAGQHQGMSNILRSITTNGKFGYLGAAEPVRIGTIESNAKNADFDSQQYRAYSPDGKSVTLCGQGGGAGAKTGLYDTPVRVGDMPNAEGEIKGGQTRRVYDADGKAVTLTARPNGGGVDGPLYAVRTPIEYNPLQSCDVVVTDQNIRCTYKDGSGTAQGYTVYFDDVKGPSVIAGHAHKMKIIEPATGKEWPVYEVWDGQITIKGEKYPVKLADGFYIIRKLTVTECKRLQTVPEDYIFPVSDTQAYKMLGNGWTVDVIAHILHYAPGITAEPLEVLSMYDGMSCGRLALDKLGAHISHYYATEIDKYAIKTTQTNFPDTIQLGDAFQVRDDGWKLPEGFEL